MDTVLGTPESFVAPPLFSGAPFDLVVIGASAGGVPAVRDVLASLPADFPVPIAIVQHIPPTTPSLLDKLWAHRTRLPVHFARNGDRLRPAQVFVAPPAWHLLIGRNRRLELEEFERINYVRPAVDVLFESAAYALGARVLGVVLTGMGADGAHGAQAIKSRGGMMIVQDPHDAEAPSMPMAAINACKIDLVLPLRSIASSLIALTSNFGARELFRGHSFRMHEN